MSRHRPGPGEPGRREGERLIAESRSEVSLSDETVTDDPDAATAAEKKQQAGLEVARHTWLAGRLGSLPGEAAWLQTGWVAGVVGEGCSSPSWGSGWSWWWRGGVGAGRRRPARLHTQSLPGSGAAIFCL